MNSIIRMASRVVARPILERASFVSKAPATTPIRFGLTLNKRYAHNQMLTFDFVRERILMTLCLFDKVDPEKLTLDSHFVNDLGLDSLDHVEIIMHIEGEFRFDIPDKDAEKLVTPRDILMYITDHEEAYEELQKLSAHDHHDHGHEHVHYTLQGLKMPGPPVPAQEKNPTHQQTRGFCTSRRNMTGASSAGDKTYIPTSFAARPPKEVKIEDIQERVMKICSKYDKIDCSKLDLASHFVQDLGLDSLDHVEIMMELEDEFGLEIPDQEAEKLMRPVEIARFIHKQEEKRALQPADRPF